MSFANEGAVSQKDPPTQSFPSIRKHLIYENYKNKIRLPGQMIKKIRSLEM